MRWNLAAMGTRAWPACVAALVLAAPSSAGEGKAASRFVDVLDLPAQPSALASSSLVVAVAAAGAPPGQGGRLVAVGQRGHIFFSTDAGERWQQAKVSVSSDLTSVCFVDARTGWAAGHDGVILHTTDGGETWLKQFDGHQGMKLILEDIERKAAADPAERLQRLLAEARRYVEDGPTKPILGLWFADARNGFAVGAHNVVFRTSDGGKTWQSWFDRTENPQLFHFNAIHGAGGKVFIAGEAGMVLTLDEAGQRFVSVQSPYKGSFFDVKRLGGTVLAVGMRGNVWRSDNDGASWQQVQTGEPSGITGIATHGDGRILLSTQGGRVLESRDGAHSFSVVAGIEPMPFAALQAVGADRLILAGTGGLRTARLK